MPTRVLRYIQVMNVISVLLFVMCCLHNGLHSNADTNGGALTVVAQDDENGEVTLEENGEEGMVPSDSSSKKEPVPLFIPTHEWQVVKEGQAIPTGLHVRMSFETGLREAKLMEGDNGLKYWKAGERQGMINPSKKTLAKEDLKKALKNFKTTDLDEIDLKREEEVKSKYRSYDELKQDFANINMNIKTDAEIVEKLVVKLGNYVAMDTGSHGDDDTNTLIATLTDLEYLLHQIDNGVLFKDIKGIPMVLKIFNTTENEEIKIESAMVLGAAMSSNPQVQVAAMELDILPILLRHIVGQASVEVRRKILFTISSLCRNFPYAQKQFLEHGGLSALGQVVKEAKTDKIQVKAVSFLNDLLTEKSFIEDKADTNNPTEAEKLHQYKLVPLQEAMVEQGWCDIIPTLLQVSDHQSREHVLLAMTTLRHSCTASFTAAKPQLQKLLVEYKVLSLEDDEEDRFFSNILSIVNDLDTFLHLKDEL